MSYNSFSCTTLLYWRPVGVIVGYGKEVVFCNILIKFQAFGGLMFWDCHPHKLNAIDFLSPSFYTLPWLQCSQSISLNP